MIKEIFMDEKKRLLVWGEREPSVYYEGRDYGSLAYVGKKKDRDCSWDRVILAIHPSAMELVSIDVVGTLSQKHFRRHRRHCLALHLGKKLKDQLCFDLGVVGLPGGVFRHWVGVCDGFALLRSWEELYSKFRKKPEIVVPAWSLKLAWEFSVKQRYPNLVILHHEGDVMILLIYSQNKLVFYQSFMVDDNFLNVFLQKWSHLDEEKVIEMPDQLLIVKKERAAFKDILDHFSWCGARNIIEVAADEKHSSLFLSAAWGSV
jgi:hypothetical protein